MMDSTLYSLVRACSSFPLLKILQDYLFLSEFSFVKYKSETIHMKSVQLVTFEDELLFNIDIQQNREKWTNTLFLNIISRAVEVFVPVIHTCSNPAEKKGPVFAPTLLSTCYPVNPQSSSTLWNYSKCGVYTVESEAGC
jgi:hypothetical protein